MHCLKCILLVNSRGPMGWVFRRLTFLYDNKVYFNCCQMDGVKGRIDKCFSTSIAHDVGVKIGWRILLSLQQLQFLPNQWPHKLLHERPEMDAAKVESSKCILYYALEIYTSIVIRVIQFHIVLFCIEIIYSKSQCKLFFWTFSGRKLDWSEKLSAPTKKKLSTCSQWISISILFVNSCEKNVSGKNNPLTEKQC